MQNRDTFSRYLQGIQGAVTIVVKKLSKRRSTQANRYLWGYVYDEVSKYTGMTPEEIHEAMKMMFRKKIVQIGDKYIETVDTTTTMTTSEFAEFIERVKSYWATEHQMIFLELDQVEV